MHVLYGRYSTRPSLIGTSFDRSIAAGLYTTKDACKTARKKTSNDLRIHRDRTDAPQHPCDETDMHHACAYMLISKVGTPLSSSWVLPDLASMRSKTRWRSPLPKLR